MKEAAPKVALVTGAAAGIGRATALRFARDGMAVGVLDIDLDGCHAVVSEIRAAGGKALALGVSISQRSQVMLAVSQLRETFGPVTILVNNAGVTGYSAFEDLTDETWDRVMEINLKGTFIVTQCVLPDMKAAKWGRIINISSSSAQTGAETMVHYSTSKGGMIAFTKSLARELGPLGITVNNIPPGTVMNTKMSEATKHRFPTPIEDLVKAMPVRRVGIPDDIANACAWLASPDTGYVTGQTIGVNGGRIMP